MTKRHRCTTLALVKNVTTSAIGLILLIDNAHAVNGALPGGFGVKNKMMGGASIALPLDATASANNPAGMVLLPSSTAANLQVFKGNSTSQFVLPGNNLSNQSTIISPEGGINWKYSDDLAFGLSFVGQGAGADYKQPILPVPGAPNGKSSLKVAEFIPTIAWKPGSELAIGLGLNIAYQQFKTNGVIVRAPVPGGLYALPPRDGESATGASLRLGAIWQAGPSVSLGASFKTKTKMGKLNAYANDLLAYSEGRLDLPSQVGFGVAWNATDKLTIAADWLRVNYADTKVMQDPNGFKWRNQSIVRVGAAWAVDNKWTLRGGFSANDGIISNDQVAQNLLVPSINRTAYTAGFSYQIDPISDVSVGYELNPRVSLNGTGPSAGTTLASKVQIFSIGYSRKF
jgi:long-chain fatty acid transport protein